MKKRLWSDIALAIVLSLCFLCAARAEADAKAAEPPKFFIGGVTYDCAGRMEDITGTGWKWEAATGSLVLDGYNGGRISVITSPLLWS